MGFSAGTSLSNPTTIPDSGQPASGLQVGSANGSVFGRAANGSLGIELGGDSNLWRAGAQQIATDSVIQASAQGVWFDGNPARIVASGGILFLLGAPSGHQIGVAGEKVGFMGAAPIVRPAITGSKAANAALASLLTQLASLGLVTDNTT